MDNQHREIKGYRELNAAEVALMNQIKQKGAELGELVAQMRAMPNPGDVVPTLPTTDKRWVSIGATHMQEGLMALTRAVAQPTFF